MKVTPRRGKLYFSDLLYIYMYAYMLRTSMIIHWLVDTRYYTH